jgi:hypothetical protein
MIGHNFYVSVCVTLLDIFQYIFSNLSNLIIIRCLLEEFEDTKEVIRIRISKKNRQHNDELISYNIQYDLLSGTLVFIFYGPIIWWNHQTQEITVNQSIMLLLERTMTTGNTAKVRVKHWITTHWPPPFLKASGCTHWYK